MDVQRAAPGWYPDSEVAGWVRWWDGMQWTERRGPPAHVQRVYPVVPPAPSDPHDRADGQAKVRFGEAVSLGFRQYARFSGRASRSEFWWWYLFVWLVAAALYLPAFVDTSNRAVQLEELCSSGSSAACLQDPTSGWITLPLVWVLGIALPTLAVLVRRLHDTGKSGAWYFLGFVPLAGPIIMLVLLAQASTPGPNQYGMPPSKGRALLAGVNRSDVAATGER